MEYYKFSDRLENLPFYMYPQLYAALNKAKKGGLELIDLGIGEPDFTPPKYVVEKLRENCLNPFLHSYSDLEGHKELRQSIANWYSLRFNVKLNPESEIITFVGSKEGISYLPLAFINEGDVSLIPDPGYSAYGYACAFAGSELEYFTLQKELNYQTDLSKIPESTAKKAKVMFLNYPNNPTGGTASLDFFERAVEFATKYNIILCHDAAYSELMFEDRKSPSLLEVKDAMKIGVEFHTLSKTFSMTGWRVGFAVGQKKIIQGLLNVKRVSSNGAFPALELAAKEALDNPFTDLNQHIKKIQNRRDFILSCLRDLGFEIPIPLGTFYMWIPIPNLKDSMALATEIISKTGVIVFPGIGFGKNGEGHLRISLVKDIPILESALKKIKPYLIRYNKTYL